MFSEPRQSQIGCVYLRPRRGQNLNTASCSTFWRYIINFKSELSLSKWQKQLRKIKNMFVRSNKGCEERVLFLGRKRGGGEGVTFYHHQALRCFQHFLFCLVITQQIVVGEFGYDNTYNTEGALRFFQEQEYNMWIRNTALNIAGYHVMLYQ